MTPPRPPLSEEQIRAVERRAFDLRDWRPRATDEPRRCAHCGEVVSGAQTEAEAAQ